ncbi:MAG: SIS domain-containing protein [Acidobacteriota bacterium]
MAALPEKDNTVTRHSGEAPAKSAPPTGVIAPSKSSLAFVRRYTQTSLETLARMPEAEIARFIDLLKEARERADQVFLCGNGGSAAMSSHLTGELGKEASRAGKRFRVVSLVDNIPWLTAIANDEDYGQIFVEQLRNYACSGDLLIAFSCSGNSANVIAAVDWANQNELVTVGVTGTPGGQLGQVAQHVIRVDSPHTGHIQEGHFLIQHLVSYYFIDAPAGKGAPR